MFYLFLQRGREGRFQYWSTLQQHLLSISIPRNLKMQIESRVITPLRSTVGRVESQARLKGNLSCRLRVRTASRLENFCAWCIFEMASVIRVIHIVMYTARQFFTFHLCCVAHTLALSYSCPLPKLLVTSNHMILLLLAIIPDPVIRQGD